MLFLTQLRFELLKMFARKRTYIAFAAFLLMEALVIFMLSRPRAQFHMRHLIEQNGYAFDTYYSGVTFAVMVIMWTTALLGSLYLALVSGDLIAKEIEEGTMRMLLCRPISRVRVTTIKFLSAIIYTFVLVSFIALTALAAGLAYRGYGGLFVTDPENGLFAIIPAARGLQLYFYAIPLLALSMSAISCIGFLFSCFNMKPAAASVVTLSAVFLDSIFRRIPYFESYRSYFLSTHMSAWTHIFENYPPWWQMLQDYSYIIGLDITCLIIGSAIFLQRDLK
jgi:ABC-2 type transport system permease protein